MMPDAPLWLILGWLFIFGSVIGSFLNVCIYRIPQHEHLWAQLSGLSNPPSSCPFCKKRILTRDNVPILGWLMLAGRCRFCRHSIPPRYALIELFNGLLWVVLYIAIVPAGMTAKISDSCLWSHLSPLAQTDPMHFSFMLHVQYFYYLILSEALLVATFIDFDLQVIPDGSTVPAMIVGVLGAVAIGNLQPWPLWFQSTSLLNEFAPLWSPAWQQQYPRLHSLAASLAGFVVGGGIIWTLRIVGQWIWKREVMGLGDVILLAMIGSFLGWQATIMIFFLAPCCGLAATIISVIIHRRFQGFEIPYGPYLSLATMLVILFWRPYFSQFERVFALGPVLVAMAIPTLLLMAAFLMLTRMIKLALGFTDDDEFYEEEWRSSDQLAFYANKDYHSGSGGLQPPDWPGRAAGQGRQFVDQWRNGGR